MKKKIKRIQEKVQLVLVSNHKMDCAKKSLPVLAAVLKMTLNTFQDILGFAYSYIVLVFLSKGAPHFLLFPLGLIQNFCFIFLFFSFFFSISLSIVLWHTTLLLTIFIDRIPKGNIETKGIKSKKYNLIKLLWPKSTLILY